MVQVSSRLVYHLGGTLDDTMDICVGSGKGTTRGSVAQIFTRAITAQDSSYRIHMEFLGQR